MICEYCRVGEYEEYCTCGKDNNICPFMRRCINDRCWKPLDTMEKCKARKDEVIVPKGLNKVRFELHGELYVEVGEFVYTIKNPYDYVPDFVKAVNKDGVWYVEGFEPKDIKKKDGDSDKKPLNRKED